MAKRGRPRSPHKATNRMRSVILTEKAFFIFEKISKQRGRSNWLHEYLSHHIIDDFEKGEKGYLLHQLLGLQKQRDRLDDQIRELGKNISKITSQEKQGEIEEELEQTIGRP